MHLENSVLRTVTWVLLALALALVLVLMLILVLRGERSI
jgi:hypothetical protein